MKYDGLIIQSTGDEFRVLAPVPFDEKPVLLRTFPTIKAAREWIDTAEARMAQVKAECERIWTTHRKQVACPECDGMGEYEVEDGVSHWGPGYYECSPNYRSETCDVCKGNRTITADVCDRCELPVEDDPGFDAVCECDEDSMITFQEQRTVAV